jgi:hypothetical protein
MDHEKIAHCRRRLEEIREIAKGIYDREERHALLELAEAFEKLSLENIQLCAVSGQN